LLFKPVSLPEPAADLPSQRPGQPPAQPFARPPARTGTAVAGLCAAVLAAILGLITIALTPPPTQVRSDVFQYAGYTAALLPAIAALLYRKRWQPLTGFALGVWYIAPGFLAWDLLAIPAFHIFSDGRFVTDILVAAVVAWYALTLRDRWLGAAVLLGWAAFTAFEYLTYLTNGEQFRHRTVAANIAAAVILAITVILVLVHGRRRPAPDPVR
jgi:hypothetical protein